MADTRLLEVRKAVKSKKPNFHIQNSNDPKKRFAGRWKRPKGLQSKMRERRKGNPKYIEPGYGSPASIRGTTPEGLFPQTVRTIKELDNTNEKSGIVISAAVGLKRRAELIKAAASKKLRILNIEPEKFAKSLDEEISSRKKRRLEILQRRKNKPETKKQGIESKVETASEEDKKKAEKAEKDKILTKKEV